MAFTTDPHAYVDLSQETPQASGTVTAVSVVSANGLAGTVANPNTAPAITLKTTITGLLKGNGTGISAATAGVDYLNVVNGWINGFTLSNDAGTPNTILDIAAGYAADSTNVTMITGTAFTKTTGGAWAAGTGNAGMGTGLTIANSTWYHVFAIINAGNYDVYFDTSATAANKPASTTAFRYIGSFKTDASAHIIAFTQTGQKFRWATGATDLTNAGPASEAALTISVPLGFVTFPILFVSTTVSSSTSSTANVYSGTSTDPDLVLFANVAAPGQKASGQCQSTSNTSSQISYNVGGSGNTMSIVTLGYINPHLAPNF